MINDPSNNTQSSSCSILVDYPNLTANHKNIIDTITETALDELINYLQSDPGFVICYQQRLLDGSISLDEFASFLDKAAANNIRPYAVYANLYQIKEFCLSHNKRKNLLERFGEYTNVIDIAALGYMNKLISNLTPPRPNQDELINIFKATETSSIPNNAWHPRDEELDILRTEAEDLQRQSIASATTKENGLEKSVRNPSLNDYNNLNTAYYYLKPSEYSIPLCFNATLTMMAQNNSADSDDVGNISFYSIVFAKNPLRIAEWVGDIKLDTFRARDHLFQSLWQANVPATHNLLNKLMTNAHYKKEITRIKKKPLIDLKSAPLNSAAMLDRLWSAYFASGESIYIKRLLSKACGVGFEDLQVQHSIPVSDFLEKAIVLAAKWSMHSNLKQHPSILVIANESTKYLSRRDKQAVITLIEGAQGLKSAMATFGMTFFDNHYSDFCLSQINQELLRLTGLTFNQKLSIDAKTLQCWIQLDDAELAKKMVEFLGKYDLAKSVTLRFTVSGHKPLILIEQPKLSALQNCNSLESGVSNKTTLKN